MASRHRIVVALVGEAPLRTEGSTSSRFKVIFFLDRIAVASPQWEDGLSPGIRVLEKLIVAQVLKNHPL
jgi:hypothetical protein